MAMRKSRKYQRDTGYKKLVQVYVQAKQETKKCHKSNIKNYAG